VTYNKLAGATMVLNVAGEPEREARSRRANGVEALLMILAVLVVLWPLAYFWGQYLEIPGVRGMAVVTLVLLAVGILCVSPWWHRDALSSWGLGSPAQLREEFRRARPAHRLLLALVLLGLFAGMNVLHYVHWESVLRLFSLRDTPLANFKGSGSGRAVILALGVLISALFLSYGVRYDNFGIALRTAFRIALPMCGLLFLAAFAQRGREAFAGAEAGALVLNAVGYVFWGFLQQLLFSGYFGNRLRKAFPPPTTAEPMASPGIVALACGALAAGFAGLVAMGLLMRWYPGEIGWSAAPWLAVFAFPVGAVYGHFLARFPRRMLVATLTATCFSVIHLNSLGLMLGTFLLGIPLAFVFMEDRNRNLVALAMVHALLGTTGNWLFSSGVSGALEVNYRVGPWHVETPTLGVLLLPLLCIAAYAAFTVWCAGNLNKSVSKFPARPASD